MGASDKLSDAVRIDEAIIGESYRWYGLPNETPFIVLGPDARDEPLGAVIRIAHGKGLVGSAYCWTPVILVPTRPYKQAARIEPEATS